MRKITKKLSAVLGLLLTYSFAFSSCGFAMNTPTNNSSSQLESSNAENSSKKEETEENMALKAISPLDGKMVNLANNDVTAFLENYEVGASAEYATGEDHFLMRGLNLKWAEEDAAEEYEVFLSLDKDLEDATVYKAEEAKLHVDDLFVNKQYYWQVSAKADGEEIAKSEIYTFKTLATPRTITMDGVSNTRDIGGKNTESGKKVKQGMIYRGAYLDEITETGIKQALETYGIKTDLDLRKAAEGTAGTSSPLGHGVQYLQYSCPYYLGNEGIGNPDNWENLANAIKVFANKENYPVFFHCSVGRDRTAMVAMFLEGLLGVSFEDMTIDYEMSFFSYRGCLDGAAPQQMAENFVNTCAYVENQYKGEENSFSAYCEAYLLKIGVTQEEIDTIREIMLEDE